MERYTEYHSGKAVIKDKSLFERCYGEIGHTRRLRG